MAVSRGSEVGVGQGCANLDGGVGVVGRGWLSPMGGSTSGRVEVGGMTVDIGVGATTEEDEERYRAMVCAHPHTFMRTFKSPRTHTCTPTFTCMGMYIYGESCVHVHMRAHECE